MSKIILLLFVISLSACATKSFQADRRQLIAKNIVHEKIGWVKDYDVLSFREDTIANAEGKPALQYALQVSYIDSSGNLQKNKGIVLFTEEGNQVISSQISPE